MTGTEFLRRRAVSQVVAKGPSPAVLDAVMSRATVEEPWTRGAYWWARIPGVIGPELGRTQVEALRLLRERIREEFSGELVERLVSRSPLMMEAAV